VLKPLGLALIMQDSEGCDVIRRLNFDISEDTRHIVVLLTRCCTRLRYLDPSPCRLLGDGG